MKKVMMTLLMIAAFSVNGFAQKGMNGIGINVPVGVYDGFTFFGIGAKYQYNISDYFRIEPSFEYFPLHSKKKVGNIDNYDYVSLKAFLNGNIFLMSPRPARPYILAGAGFSMWNYSRILTDYSLSESSECFAYNVGVGYDIRLSHSFAMQIEATAFSSVGDNAIKDSDEDYVHSNKFLFMGRIGFTYTF